MGFLPRKYNAPFIILVLSMLLVLIIFQSEGYITKKLNPDSFRPISSCQAISNPGTYTLTKDITNVQGTCFEIMTNDVKIDCQNHKVYGDNLDQDAGIRAKSVRNIIIKNCEISGFAEGIELRNTEDSKLEGNSIIATSNGIHGIFLMDRSSNNIIKNNKIFHNIDNAQIFHGLFLGFYSSLNNVDGNIISLYNPQMVGPAVMLTVFADNNILTNNNIFTNGLSSWGLILDEVKGNEIIDSSIDATDFTDVWALDKGHNLILNTVFNQDETEVIQDASIEVQWYLQIKAISTTNVPIENARVEIKDNQNNIVFEGFTDTSGLTEMWPTTQYIQNEGGRTYMTDYTISVSKDGFVPYSNTINLESNTIHEARLRTSLIQKSYGLN